MANINPTKRLFFSASKERRVRLKLIHEIDVVMDDQLNRIMDRFAETERRLHAEYQRCSLDEMEAGMELTRKMGNGGLSGPRHGDLGYYDRNSR